MNALEITLPLSCLGLLLGCASTEGELYADVQASLPLEGPALVESSARAFRTEGGGLRLVDLRFQVTDPSSGITRLETVFFDDDNGDGVPQGSEERGRITAQLASPTPFVSFGGMSARAPLATPRLWARVTTDRGIVTESWSIDG